jgi:hypothetical protein
MKIRVMKYLKLLVVIQILTIYGASAVADPSDFGNPNIVPPQAEFRDLTYSEWLVEWLKWANSLPLNHHPLTDTADCSTGQTGNVWFIDGTIGTAFPPEGRDCTISPGTALFINLNASSWDNEACSSDPVPVIKKTNFSEAQLRALASHDLVEGYGFRKVIIDGVEVHGLPALGVCDLANPALCQSPFRVQTPVFDYTVPAFHNTLIFFDGDCYDDPNNNGQPYTVNGAVADGVGVMIKPLKKGKHVLQFGKLNSAGIPNRLYRINVTEQENKKEKGNNSFN